MNKHQPSKTASENAFDASPDLILDTAVRLAEKNSWESLRLHHIAHELDIDLEVINIFYRQKDDLVEAWYDRADLAMLSDAAKPDYQSLTTRERIHRSIMCWLLSMQNHHKVSRDMLMYKLELGHIHLQVLGLLRISRTVQWIMESAHRDSIHLRRVIEEITLTNIYLTAFSHWLFDNSKEAEKTSHLLDRMLRSADSLAKFFLPFSSRESSPTPKAYEAGKVDTEQGAESSLH